MGENPIQFMNEINAVVISVNNKGEIIYLSPYCEVLLGYKINDKLKKEWWEKISFSNDEIALNKLKIEEISKGKLKISAKPYESKVKCSDGNFKWIEWRDTVSDANTFTTVGVDITNRKSQEIASFHSNDIINSVDAMILVSDKNDNVIFCSPSVERMLGYRDEEIMGDKWWKLTYENQYEAKKVKEAIHNLIYFHIKDFTDISKRQIKTKNGDYKWIEWQLSKGLNDTYISVGTDITSRVKTEMELKQAKDTAEKSLKVKDEFLANMSHEIRTPLNAVIGFTDLLLETQLTTEQKEHLETMRNSGEILLSLINNVLDLAKLDSNKVEIEEIPFNLHKSLYEVVKLMKLKAKEKKITLNLDIDPNTPEYVLGDPTRIGQILLNLIGNAIKFTDEGSVGVLVKLVKDENNLADIYFEIKDTGIGIVSNKISTVFGVFTQAKSDTSRIYGGTGLGLAIVKKLVALLEGEIKVQSKFGVGSNFKMTIPFKKDVTKIEKHFVELDEAENSTLELKILLVEDNKTNQLLAKTRLERWNCTVDIANNGIEGVKKVQKNMYDIILMDIQMPVMDGYEATKIIKNDLSKQVSRIPIIAMTAYTSKNDIDMALEAGMNDYIFKPFKKEELLLLLKKYGKSISSEKFEAKKSEGEISTKNAIQEKYTDLEFLKQESLNETSILVLLIQLFLKDLDEYVKVVTKEIKTKNWEALHRATHKIKPNISMFGISKMETMIHSLMRNLEKKENLDGVEVVLNNCKEIIEKVKEELVEELKMLENE
ncbi:response regulator [Lutibacter sp.]|uniref:response regulator n=1 Tax=Lutibacter sp. TaxID=1925666 RepID=UPI001A2432FF|nr:response regulator [Lutibacter sp.]MBI9040014.1 response regulator [Lutibacter sp.]